MPMQIPIGSKFRPQPQVNTFFDSTYEMLSGVTYLRHSKEDNTQISRTDFENITDGIQVSFDKKEPKTGRAYEYATKLTYTILQDAKYTAEPIAIFSSELQLRAAINGVLIAMMNELNANKNNKAFIETNEIKLMWHFRMVINEADQLPTVAERADYLSKALEPEKERHAGFLRLIFRIKKQYQQSMIDEEEEIVVKGHPNSTGDLGYIR